jgi:hypothetical protein
MTRLAVIVAVIVGLGIFGLFFFRVPQPSEPSPTATTTQTGVETQEPRQPPLGWRVYENERYHFSLFYPDALTIQEYDEGAGAITIIFQNPDKGLGFQLFIVPYSLDQVTDERFKRDVPSGVRKDLTNATVDGAVGAAFHSEHALLGETREVWLIKSGLLYEATAPRALEELLHEILQTWDFI